MRQCQNAPMVVVYLRGCGTSIFSVSHWTISGDLRNCDLHNHGVRCGPKGSSLLFPRTEARLTRAENGRPNGCQKEIPGRRLRSLAGSSQIGVSTERTGPMRQCRMPQWSWSIPACAEVPLRYSVRKGHQSAGKRTACLEKCNRYWACRPTHAGAAPASLPKGAIAAGFPPSAGAPSPAGPPPPPPSARRRRWAPRRG